MRWPSSAVPETLKIRSGGGFVGHFKDDVAFAVSLTAQHENSIVERVAEIAAPRRVRQPFSGPAAESTLQDRFPGDVLRSSCNQGDELPLRRTFP